MSPIRSIQLKTLSIHIIMTSIVQDIQVIRSLRKDLRDLKLPPNILNSIGAIHNCIKSGSDLGGWKKVEWRGSKGAVSNYSQGFRGSGGAGAGAGSGSGSGFFINRQTHTPRNEITTQSYNFGNRHKTMPQQTPPQSSSSIPLSGNTTSSSTTNSSTTNSSTTNNTAPVDTCKPVHYKYISKFRKSSEKVEDTILNTIILGKLNKFSEQNYPEIKEFITHIIDNGQTDMIKCFMKLVFEKAASEEIFCPLYAKLLSELSARYPILLTEMANLYSEYMEIFEEVSENSAQDYNEVCKRNLEKKYRRGYSQFLAELIKHDVINTDTFMKTINKIITQIENKVAMKDAIKLNEEYADCLMKIMKAIQTSKADEYDSDTENSENRIDVIRQTLKSNSISRIQELTLRKSENVGLSNKARFTFLDIYEGIQKF
jgi:hypothetical protein